MGTAELLANSCPFRQATEQQTTPNGAVWEAFVPEILDAVDARILDLIQHDAGLSVAEIAERVGLSSSPCWRRIKRLEDTGVIQRRVTILDREKLGLGFEVYATVKLSLPTKDNLDAFETAVMRWPEVVSCATVTGAADYELRIITRDMHAFDAFLRDKILSLGLVSNIESRIVIRGVKNATAVPLGLVSPYVTTQPADIAGPRTVAALSAR
jgi:DNA-binding Lrp family transcriptional regulator